MSNTSTTQPTSVIDSADGNTPATSQIPPVFMSSCADCDTGNRVASMVPNVLTYNLGIPNKLFTSNDFIVIDKSNSFFDNFNICAPTTRISYSRFPWIIDMCLETLTLSASTFFGMGIGTLLFGNKTCTSTNNVLSDTDITTDLKRASIIGFVVCVGCRTINKIHGWFKCEKTPQYFTN